MSRSSGGPIRKSGKSVQTPHGRSPTPSPRDRALISPRALFPTHHQAFLPPTFTSPLRSPSPPAGYALLRHACLLTTPASSSGLDCLNVRRIHCRLSPWRPRHVTAPLTWCLSSSRCILARHKPFRYHRGSQDPHVTSFFAGAPGMTHGCSRAEVVASS